MRLGHEDCTEVGIVAGTGTLLVGRYLSLALDERMNGSLPTYLYNNESLASFLHTIRKQSLFLAPLTPSLPQEQHKQVELAACAMADKTFSSPRVVDP